MSFSPFKDSLCSPHFYEPFKFSTPEKINYLSACPNFTSEEVELSRLGPSLADLTDIIPCTSEVLDADALLEGLDHESEVHFEEPKSSFGDTISNEVLETNTCDFSVEVLSEEDCMESSSGHWQGDELSEKRDCDLHPRKSPRDALRMERWRWPSFKVVPASVKYQALGEKIYVPLSSPERRADFSEPGGPDFEPEATFVWKEKNGLKLEKVKNYEEFGLPLTDWKLHKKWRSNTSRRNYFKEPSLDVCRMQNPVESSESSFEEETKFHLPEFKVPVIHHSEFEEPVLLHLESGEPVIVQKVLKKSGKRNFGCQFQRLCNLLPLKQDPTKMPMETILEAACIFVRHISDQQQQLSRVRAVEMKKRSLLRNRLALAVLSKCSLHS